MHRRARWFLTSWLYAAALSVPSVPLVAQDDSESPEQIALRSAAATRNGDWYEVARLMHPSALRQFRLFLEPLLTAPSRDDARQQIVGISSTDSIRAMSDTALFARVIGRVTQDEAMGDLLKTSNVDVLGRVPEGNDTVHLVVRTRVTIEGVPVTQLDVVSLARTPAGWREILSADFAELAAAIRRLVRT